MDPDTTAWMGALQDGPHDAPGLAAICAGLSRELPRLQADDDRETIEMRLSQLEAWAAAAPPQLGAATYVQCGRIADRRLREPARAQEFYTLAIDLDPSNVDALEYLQVLLVAAGQHERLEAILNLQVTALRDLPDADPEAVAYVWSLLGFMYAEHSGDLNAGIEAYERAMDACPNVDTMSELAGVYMLRGEEGDEAEAAELYCALGEVLEGDERVVALQMALDNQPDHSEALSLLEQTLEDGGDSSELVKRWRAYLQSAPYGAESEGRRRDLAQALVAADQPQEALEVLQPLCEMGNEIARHMRENILEGCADAGHPIAPSVPASRSGHTQVGFRLPAFQHKDRPQVRERRAALAGVGSRLRASLGKPRSDRPPPMNVAGPAAAPSDEPPAAAVAQSPQPPAEPSAVSAPAAPQPAAAPPAAAVAQSPQPPAEPSAVSASAAPQPAVEANVERGSLQPIVLPAAAAPIADLSSPLDSTPPPGPARRLVDGAAAWPMSRWAAVAAAALLALGGAWLAAGGDGGGAPSVAGATANSEDGSDQAADGDDEADGDDAMEADGSSPDQVRGRVRLARSEVRSSGGKLARAEMMRSIRRTLPKVRRCYRRALERNPELAGRVTFRLTVEPGGKVSDAKRAGGTLVDAAMTRCATRAIERTRFAKPKGAAAKVTFPLRFRAD